MRRIAFLCAFACGLVLLAATAPCAAGPSAEAASGGAAAQEVRPAMEFHLLAPAYRGQVARFTAGKSLAGRVSIDREGHGLKGKQLTVEWSLRRGEQVIIARHNDLGPESESYEWFDKLPELAAGRYELRVRLLDEHRSAVAEHVESIDVVQPADLYQRVWIDQQRRLMVDGKPFFPLGLYLGPTEDEHLARIAQAGFNTILCYGYGVGPDPKAYMDRAQAHGLKVIYSIKDFYEGTKSFPAAGKSGIELAREYVTLLRDHPALLAWYINDELDAQWIPRLKEMYDLVRELDEKHPAFQVLCRPAELGEYYRVTDVLGVDPYPVPRHPIDMVGDWMDKAVEAMHRRKPVWVVPQLHKGAIYSGEEKDREPTFEEKRCMAYLGIIHGAQGMIFYSYSDLLRETGKTKAPPEVFERRWQEASRIAAEMRNLAPIVLNGTSVGRLAMNPGVHASMLKVSRQFFVIAANTSSDRASDLVMKAPVYVKQEAEDVLSGSKVALEGGVLRDTLKPLEVKVLKMEPPA